ncbi:MAG TPA: hypothetical protein VF765_38375 [Polyangiaceae bacterium]
MRVARLLVLSGVFALVPSCGGSAFSSGGSTDGGNGSEGGRSDAAGVEAGPPLEAGPVGTYCGPDIVCTGTGMQQGSVCCITSNNPPAYGCAGANCGCDTQLDCSSDAECGALRCCIRNATDSACSGGHWVARCAADCVGGFHMCVPGAGAMQCLVGQSCSMDTSNAGLPPQSGFGICK